MMTRAIEGMDSGNPMEGDRSISRDERLSLSPPLAVPQVIRECGCEVRLLCRPPEKVDQEERDD